MIIDGIYIIPTSPKIVYHDLCDRCVTDYCPTQVLNNYTLSMPAQVKLAAAYHINVVGVG